MIRGPHRSAENLYQVLIVSVRLPTHGMAKVKSRGAKKVAPPELWRVQLHDFCRSSRSRQTSGDEGVIVFLGNAQINGSCLNSIISNGRSVRLLRVIQKNALVLGKGFF